jgi:hypothetical protein
MAPPKPVLGKWLLVALLCLLGIGVNCFLKWPILGYIIHGDNDFIGYYAGAELAGSPDLYNADAVARTELPLCEIPRFLAWIRLPFYATLISPLRLWSFQHAYWVWQFVSLIALLGFIYYFPAPRWMTILACCWSVPLLECFIMGRDVVFVMVVLAVALSLFTRGKHFAAGSVLSLCLIKYNLFLLLPLLIVGKRLWRLGTGFIAGGAVLAVVSFAVAGWAWPIHYLEILRLPPTTPQSDGLPNLHGLFALQQNSFLWQAAGTVLVLVVTWLVIRRADTARAFAVTLIGGLLVSYHAFFGDTFILLPAALFLVSAPAGELDLPTGIFLLSPIASLPFLLPKAPYPPAVLLVAILVLLAAPDLWKSLRFPVLKSAN